MGALVTSANVEDPGEDLPQLENEWLLDVFEYVSEKIARHTAELEDEDDDLRNYG